MSVRLDGDGGSVTISDAVLSEIVLQAVEVVDGARVRRALRLPRRHLEVEVEGGRARVELELAVRYGIVLPEAARDVQARVADALATMVDLDVEAVDVSIEELEGAGA
jgi:uncharacterized alkaline shock family protein YloU